MVVTLRHRGHRHWNILGYIRDSQQVIQALTPVFIEFDDFLYCTKSCWDLSRDIYITNS